ncbi:hypothetical protein [Flavisolibacter nicotianae]
MDGEQDILGIIPESIHQRSVLYVGNTTMMDELGSALKAFGEKEVAE